MYRPEVLRKVLIKKWNLYVKSYYILNGLSGIEDSLDMDISLDLEEHGNNSFVENLSQKLNVRKEDISKKIVDYIDKLRLIANKIKNPVVFGTGIVVKRYLGVLEDKLNVGAFVRNDCKDGELFNNKVVISPDKIDNYNFDYVLVGSNVFFDEIRKQLVGECAVDAGRILPIEIVKFRK